MSNILKRVADKTIIQAVKDFVRKPDWRKSIIKDLRSEWMQMFTNGRSLKIAKQLEEHPKTIIAKFRKQEMEETEIEESIIPN